MSLEESITPIVSNKPYPVSIEMRPLWRICLIVTSIAVVAAEKKYLDLKKVNILVWMLIRREKWSEYGDYLLGRAIDVPLVSVDTATFKAVEFSIAKGVVRLEGGRLHITERAVKLLLMLEDNGIMEEERAFLEELGHKLTEAKVSGLTGGNL